MNGPVQIESKLSSEPFWTGICWTALFSAAFGVVEAMVVVYIRAAFYPDGFSFPLIRPPDNLVILEICREAATIVMLAAVSALAAKRFWERFGYFIIAFGVWDIVFYLWLRIAIGWPLSLLDWDILFLIPLPWIAPVLAPVLIALEMIIIGILIVRRFACGGVFNPTGMSWVCAILATALALWSFMSDTASTLGGEPPMPYKWPLLILALAGYGVSYWKGSHNESGENR
jgi:hypothetical protein